jgi:hypothetical protein
MLQATWGAIKQLHPAAAAGSVVAEPGLPFEWMAVLWRHGLVHTTNPSVSETHQCQFKAAQLQTYRRGRQAWEWTAAAQPLWLSAVARAHSFGHSRRRNSIAHLCNYSLPVHLDHPGIVSPPPNLCHCLHDHILGGHLCDSSAGWPPCRCSSWCWAHFWGATGGQQSTSQMCQRLLWQTRSCLQRRPGSLTKVDRSFTTQRSHPWCSASVAKCLSLPLPCSQPQSLRGPCLRFCDAEHTLQPKQRLCRCCRQAGRQPAGGSNGIPAAACRGSPASAAVTTQ